MWSNLTKKDRNRVKLLEDKIKKIDVQYLEIQKTLEHLEMLSQEYNSISKQLDNKITKMLRIAEVQTVCSKESKDEIGRCHKNIELLERQVSLLKDVLVKADYNIENHNHLIVDSVNDMQKVALELRNGEAINKLNRKLEDVFQEISLLDQTTRLFLVGSVIDSMEKTIKDYEK